MQQGLAQKDQILPVISIKPDERNNVHGNLRLTNNHLLVADKQHILDFSARSIYNGSQDKYSNFSPQMSLPSPTYSNPYTKLLHHQSHDDMPQYNTFQNPGNFKQYLQDFYNKPATEPSNYYTVKSISADHHQIPLRRQLGQSHFENSHFNATQLFAVPQVPRKRQLKPESVTEECSIPFTQSKFPRDDKNPEHDFRIKDSTINQLPDVECSENVNLLEVDNCNVIMEETSPSSSNTSENSPISLPEIKTETKQNEDADIFDDDFPNSKLTGILQSHCLAIRQMMTPSVAKIVKKLGTIHSGETSAINNITRAEFITHLVNMSERFRHFALQQK